MNASSTLRAMHYLRICGNASLAQGFRHKHVTGEAAGLGPLAKYILDRQGNLFGRTLELQTPIPPLDDNDRFRFYRHETPIMCMYYCLVRPTYFDCREEYFLQTALASVENTFVPLPPAQIRPEDDG
jgi:hypothetical protein